MLCRAGRAVRMTEDHKPNLPAEAERIRQVGGRIEFSKCWRVVLEPLGLRPGSGLAVSRSFGDLDFKEPCRLHPPSSPYLGTCSRTDMGHVGVPLAFVIAYALMPQLLCQSRSTGLSTSRALLKLTSTAPAACLKPHLRLAKYLKTCHTHVAAVGPSRNLTLQSSSWSCPQAGGM